MELAKKLKEMRKAKKMTQKQLAEKLHMSESVVKLWENKEAEPSYDILCEIAKILEVSVDQLLGVEVY